MYEDKAYKIKATDVLDKTNGGLDIILHYYPQAMEVVDGKKKHFKLRNEKTPSARLTQVKNSGVWIVTDFGDDQKSRNAIEVVRMEENLGFKEALEFIVGKWNLDIKGAEYHAPRAGLEKRAVKPDEKEGDFIPRIRANEDGEPTFTDAELAVFGPFVTAEHLLDHNIYALIKYTRVKDRKATEISSNEDFPIFMIDRGSFQKIYQPKSADKRFRFSYAGTRPKEYVFGLDQIKAAHQAGQKALDEENSALDPEDLKKVQTEYKLPYIFHCMGDRDAINVYSLSIDYHVIWLNSESQQLSGSEFAAIMHMTDNFIQIPDLDETGVKHGIRQALKYLELKTLWLPKELRNLRDFRGNKCKDVTDFIKRWNIDRVKKEFKALIHTTMTARFWDTIHTRDGHRLKFNPEHFFYFLNLRGMYHFQIKEDKDIFIRVEDHIVSEIEVVSRIKKEIKTFLRQRRYGVDVLNLVNTTPLMTEEKLSGLAYPQDSYIPRDLNFCDAGHDFQFLFFADKIWKITTDEITESKPEAYSNVIWKDKVINRKVKLSDEAFSISCEVQDADRQFDIEIKDPDNQFLQYLIQTSRVHWRKDLEDSFSDPTGEKARAYAQKYKYAIDGPNLQPDEIYEQKMHLINKLYALGYLLHRYKDPSRPWAVFTMDNKESATGESSGGSGKSIYMQSVTNFMKWEYLNGKNKNLTKNPHVFENITEHTDYVLVDDADQYFDFDFFYNAITGHTEVNPKGTKSMKIPFEKSPKYGFSTNHTLRKNDESTQRRVLYTVFSDYFHDNASGEYLQTRTPLSDMGSRLFDDWDDDQWNRFINLMAQCVKFYLNYDKINPPMGNVQRRNLRAEAGEIFFAWADVYFAQEGRLNGEVTKDNAFKDFQEATNSKTWKPHRFTKSLQAWCRYNLYIYNPESMCNSGNGDKKNRIIRSVNGVSTEMFFIDTRGDVAKTEKGQQEEMPW